MTNITIPIVNKTGLDTSKYTIYVLGFSPTSMKYLFKQGATTTAKFVEITSGSGTIPAYKLGTELTEIEIDKTPSAADPEVPANKIDGARIYFFIAENSEFPSAPTITYTDNGASVTNVKNPPNTDVPPYTFAEFTLVDLTYGAVIDSQTVDGFVFPVSIKLEDDTGTELGQVGQPPTVNRSDILKAFEPFMLSVETKNNAGDNATAFNDLQYSENGGGLLNPGAYLNDRSKTGEFNNLDSPLNSLFDADLTTFFSNDKLSIQGVANGTIMADIYTAVSGEQQLPGSSFSHQALHFTGKIYKLTFDVFSPVEICILNYPISGGNAPITGSIDTLQLTLENTLPQNTAILENMFVQGAGIPANLILVKSINRNVSKQITSIDLGLDLGQTAAGSEYSFSKPVVKTQYTGTINNTTLTFPQALPAASPLAVGMAVQGPGVAANTTIKNITQNAAMEITAVVLSADAGQPAPNSTYAFFTPEKESSYKGSIDTTTLTFQAALQTDSPLVEGMEVSGPGIPGNITVKSITRNLQKEITAVELTTDLGKPTANSQYSFSKVKGMFLTSGNMVFGNQGVFAYSEGVTKEMQPVLLNLQNQIVTAFNRGVANLSPSSGEDGYSTKYWGTQPNWYPEDSIQNLFSLFMHTGTVADKTPIFLQASDSVNCARGTKMGQSYGFAYDENAGPVPPAPKRQPDVPSKYDPISTKATTVTITLGPWGT